MSEPLLEVEGLEKHYPITEGLLRRETGRVRAVDGIDFTVQRGETFGLIGESGCGKSTAVRTVLRLEEPTGGTVRFAGEDIGTYDGEELRAFRRRAQVVLQNPTGSFDPRMTIGESVAEPLRVHGYADRADRRAVVEDLLDRVGLSAETAGRYPHELSGGQKQRAAMARALVLNPDLLIADEPVSALDVSVKAEILALLGDLQREYDLTVLIVSHDMGVIREVCDRAAVMYAGEIAEVGPTEALFETPHHPYTGALVDAVPTPDPQSGGRTVDLDGEVPDPADPPAGCRFHPRCPEVIPPEEFAGEQRSFRAIMRFRTAVTTGAFDPEAVRERADGSDPAMAIREEYGLPNRLDDAEATDALADAIQAAVGGDPAAARATLDEAFPSPCVEADPATRDTGPGRRTACHLYGED